MSETKSIRKYFAKLFSKKKNNTIKLHYKPSIEEEVTEDESGLDAGGIINDKIKSLKRHQTCSFDLSDKTLRLRNTQELTSIVETGTSVHRTSSFDIDRDFPKKLLPITDFEEKEVIGEGAFGRAVKVQHIKSGSYFVLKEVLSHSKENEDTLIREVNLLRSLRHNNVLTTVALVLKDKLICLLTELMHGGSLQTKISNLEEEISVNQKLLFLRDIAAGMNFLHQNSIMHRDLTSSNCLLRWNNTVVVSDFGLSKMLYGDVDGPRFSHPKLEQSIRCSSTETINSVHRLRTSSTLDVDPNPKMRNYLSVGNISQINKRDSDVSGDDEVIFRQTSEKRRTMNIKRKHTVVGNPFWMAPEMLAGKTYNRLVDLYSFGIIGCEVTARVSAHPDHLERFHKNMSVNFEAFITKHKHKELANCPEEVLDLIKKCCNPNPDERPTFNTLLSWLEDILFRLTNNIMLNNRWSRSLESD